MVTNRRASDQDYYKKKSRRWKKMNMKNNDFRRMEKIAARMKIPKKDETFEIKQEIEKLLEEKEVLFDKCEKTDDFVKLGRYVKEINIKAAEIEKLVIIGNMKFGPDGME